MSHEFFRVFSLNKSLQKHYFEKKKPSNYTFILLDERSMEIYGFTHLPFTSRHGHTGGNVKFLRFSFTSSLQSFEHKSFRIKAN